MLFDFSSTQKVLIFLTKTAWHDEEDKKSTQHCDDRSGANDYSGPANLNLTKFEEKSGNLGDFDWNFVKI